VGAVFSVKRCDLGGVCLCKAGKVCDCLKSSLCALRLRAAPIPVTVADVADADVDKSYHVGSQNHCTTD